MSLEQANPFEEKKMHTVQGNLLMEQNPKRRIIYDRAHGITHCSYINDGKFNFKEESYTKEGECVLSRHPNNQSTGGVWYNGKMQQEGTFAVYDNLLIDFYENKDIHGIQILDQYNTKREVVLFYKDGKPQHYYKRDEDGKGLSVSLKDCEGSPLEQMSETYYGNTHGIGVIFNDKAISSLSYNIVDGDSLVLSLDGSADKSQQLIQYYPSGNLKYHASMYPDENKITYLYFQDQQTDIGTVFETADVDIKTGEVLQQLHRCLVSGYNEGLTGNKDGLRVDFQNRNAGFYTEKLIYEDPDMYLLQALPLDAPNFPRKCDFLLKRCEESAPHIREMIKSSKFGMFETLVPVYESYEKDIHARIDNLKNQAGLKL